MPAKPAYSWASMAPRSVIFMTAVASVVIGISLAALPRMSVAQPATLSGQVRYYETGAAVRDVSVELLGPLPAVGPTDSDGQYRFTGLNTAVWQLAPHKSGEVSAAISLSDALYTLQAAVGLRSFNQAQQLACDVSGNGTVSSFDALLILQRVVSLITQFPVTQRCGSDWLFIPAPATAPNQQVAAPQVTGTPCRPGTIFYQPLTGTASNQDFTAVLVGDCTGNWQPDGTVPAATLAPSRTATTTASATRPSTATMTPPPTATATPVPSATPTATATPHGPTLAGCQMFPSDNPWNRDISGDPVDPNSANYVASVNLGATHLHADFGAPADYGIPFVVVPSSQPMVPITFNEYGDESDPGPYPVPSTAPIEAGSDHHVLVLQAEACRLYELYHASKDLVGSGWHAGSGAVFDLWSNALRPEAWTSADAAGLPILPGLVRYDEVAAGEIKHAVRFTVWRAQQGWVHPATHYGTTSNVNDPPMGTRFRLKASFSISGFTGQARVVLAALQRYGMLVADTGSSWFITGATDPRWNDDDLNQLKTVPGTAFEVVRIDEIHYPPW